MRAQVIRMSGDVVMLLLRNRNILLRQLATVTVN